MARTAWRDDQLSILADLAATAQSLVSRYGLVGVFLAMTVESAGVPLPSEVTMPLGALGAVGRGDGALAEVIAAGTAGNLLGSGVAYAIGAALGREWRGGRWLNREHWEAAHRWFARYGDRAVFFGRLLPVVRTYISFPAGAASMPLGRFALYTAAGSALWAAALAIAGYALGTSWGSMEPFFRGFTDLTVAAAIAAATLWLLLRRRRKG